MTNQDTTRYLSRIFAALLCAVTLQCEKTEQVAFDPIVGKVNENGKGSIIEVNAPCAPGDTLMTYPSFNQSGVTTLYTDENRELWATSYDCRVFFPSTVQSAERGAAFDAATSCDREIGLSFACDPDSGQELSYWEEMGREQSEATGDPTYATSSWAEHWYQFYYPQTCFDTQVFEYFSPHVFSLEHFPVYSYDDLEDDSIGISTPEAPYKWHSAFVLDPDGGMNWMGNGEVIPDDATVFWLNAAAMPSPATGIIAVGGMARGTLTDEREIQDSLATADELTGEIAWMTDISKYGDGSARLQKIISLAYAPDVPLVDIWAVTVADFWVVGNDLQRACPRVTGKVFHCNNTACEEEVVVPGVFLKSIFARSASDIYVVGGNDEINGAGVLLRRHGGKWTNEALPTTEPLNKIWGPPSGELYIVGGSQGDEPSGVALRQSGTSWEILPVNAERPLYDVKQTDDGVVHMAGEEGFFTYLPHS